VTFLMSATGKQDCLVVAVLFILCGCFLIVLRFYGLTLPCPWPPDEIVYTQPAENLAKGKGMGVPACDDLLPGITKRAYLQVPVYFLAVSLWGRTFGFELGALRAFNQCLGVLGLILLFALARRWGLQPAWALLAVHWTALDIAYQLNSNIARMDALCLIFTLAMLLTFTEGWERTDDRWLLLAGLLGTLAILTHLLAVPVVGLLALLLLMRRRWKGLTLFGLPIFIGLVSWVSYGAQDWSSFIAQLRAPFQRKAERTALQFFAHALMLGGLGNIFALCPSNMPPWISIFGATALMVKRGVFSLHRWKWLALFVAYLTAALNAEMWYFGWFTPFGYLLTVAFLLSLLRLQPTRRTQQVLAVLIALWTMFQSFQVARCLLAVPPLQRTYRQFYAQLERQLPPEGTVVLFCAPDPYFHLRQTRPDLRLYELLPLRMQKAALQRLMEQADAFVFVVWGWAIERDITHFPKHQVQWRTYPMPTAVATYRVAIGIRQGKVRRR
jgi:4-amino-4-deoxy-L-arabinose transferase-like glycosyltransferase